MSRLTIDITDRQHQSLKASAALQGKTIKQFALERLFPDRLGDDEAWQQLNTLLAQRVANGLAGNLSALSVEDIFAAELQSDRRA